MNLAIVEQCVTAEDFQAATAAVVNKLVEVGFLSPDPAQPEQFKINEPHP